MNDEAVIFPVPLALIMILIGLAGAWAAYVSWNKRELHFIESAILGIAAALITWAGVDSLVRLSA